MSTQNEVDVKEQESEEVDGIRRRPRPVDGLAAGEMPEPRQLEERLKAERVQEQLKALPGWQLSWREQAINRAREFGTPQDAASFASFVAGLAAGANQMVNVFLAGAHVMVTLLGRPVRGGGRGLSQSVVDFARRIG